jgi:transposase InsO family protein
LHPFGANRQRWLAQNWIKTIYIDPGSPWQNGFVESFHGFLTAHWDHEPALGRSAAVCGRGGTSRSTLENAHALRLVFDTAAVRIQS